MTESAFPVKFSPYAIEMAQKLAVQNSQWHGCPLRVYLDGKGCDGFYYGVAFDKHEDGDCQTQLADGLEAVVDQETALFVKGSSIDWVDDERGRGFLVDNPNHRKFRGKFYRRKTWRQRLEATPD